MKAKYLFLFLIVVLIVPQIVLGADCDYTPLNNKISQLEKENGVLKEINNSYSKLLPECIALKESYDNLSDEFDRVKSERDYFESKYLNTSLGNMTIGDFIIYMNNIENHYNSINQSINTQINQMIKIRNWTIAISVTFSIALLSITFILFKFMRKSIITKISEITKINVKHETKIDKR